MTYRVCLPTPTPSANRAPRLDLIDGGSTAVQRQVRRVGIGGYETPTMATLLAVASTQDGLVFFDVGANVGLYAAMVASLFDPEQVVAFEPTPSTAEIARRIVRVNRLAVQVEQLALGATNGSAELFLSAKSDASNSLVEGFKASTGTVTINVERLDDYVARTSLVPTLLKIDTETFEPQVIAGGRFVLREHRPTIIAEVLHRRRHDHGDELTEAMAGLGYHYYRIGEHGPDGPHAVIRGDARSPHHDWLLTPEPFDATLLDAYQAWSSSLARCGPETHPRLPLLRTIRAVARTEGWPAVARAGRNRLQRMLRSG